MILVSSKRANNVTARNSCQALPWCSCLSRVGSPRWWLLSPSPINWEVFLFHLAGAPLMRPFCLNHIVLKWSVTFQSGLRPRTGRQQLPVHALTLSVNATWGQVQTSSFVKQSSWVQLTYRWVWILPGKGCTCNDLCSTSVSSESQCIWKD